MDSFTVVSSTITQSAPGGISTGYLSLLRNMQLETLQLAAGGNIDSKANDKHPEQLYKESID